MTISILLYCIQSGCQVIGQVKKEENRALQPQKIGQKKDFPPKKKGDKNRTFLKKIIFFLLYLFI